MPLFAVTDTWPLTPATFWNDICPPEVDRWSSFSGWRHSFVWDLSRKCSNPSAYIPRAHRCFPELLGTTDICLSVWNRSQRVCMCVCSFPSWKGSEGASIHFVGHDTSRTYLRATPSSLNRLIQRRGCQVYRTGYRRNPRPWVRASCGLVRWGAIRPADDRPPDDSRRPSVWLKSSREVFVSWVAHSLLTVVGPKASATQVNQSSPWRPQPPDWR